MRYLMALMLLCFASSSWAEMILTIVDQDDLPVVGAVVSLPGHVVSTPTKVAVMDQIDESFVPRVLVVQKGQFVSFPNSDDIRHHVYSFSEPKRFEIKLYKGSDMPPVLFDKPGLVALGCNIHDDMIGYIVVADNSLTLKTDANGQVRLPAKPGDSALLWSERTLDGVGATQKISLTYDQTVKLDLLPPIESMDHSTHTGFGKKKWSQ
ncbi:methylamine utilization protein [Marinomonas sp. M1K-6]|uniref:Methylamine utilization protein n=1 Tax=Marinomonas profundi TaxID=2726122 RepID=A0A847QVG7_9GAMM|nr:methylamine utilization protein [Marinomonas profundi]NLQ16928.1 methylamine utilization protein [Marinomonas profundi]UDV02658.1 methylamine utilization protein [Marinomonas profundi]